MLSTLGLFILHALGLTTLSQHNVVVEQAQVYRHRVFKLRAYLKGLATDTPHSNIQGDIGNVLNQDSTTVHSDLLD